MQMPGWFSEEAARASRQKRSSAGSLSRVAGASAAFARSLTATCRPASGSPPRRPRPCRPGPTCGRSCSARAAFQEPVLSLQHLACSRRMRQVFVSAHDSLPGAKALRASEATDLNFAGVGTLVSPVHFPHLAPNRQLTQRQVPARHMAVWSASRTSGPRVPDKRGF